MSRSALDICNTQTTSFLLLLQFLAKRFTLSKNQVYFHQIYSMIGISMFIVIGLIKKIRCSYFVQIRNILFFLMNGQIVYKKMMS